LFSLETVLSGATATISIRIASTTRVTITKNPSGVFTASMIFVQFE